ncbi:universal stress protein [Candidatus Pyrohabitans sp.]
MRRVLLCIDGEGHTRKAVAYALALARGLNSELTALHVIDGFLLEKRISHEIYAVGREEYRAYVKEELQKEAERILQEFERLARDAGVKFRTKLRFGHPVEEVIAEAEEGSYDLVILGGKRRRGLWELKSRNLPLKVFRRLKMPVMVVR